MLAREMSHKLQVSNRKNILFVQCAPDGAHSFSEVVYGKQAEGRWWLKVVGKPLFEVASLCPECQARLKLIGVANESK
jgi:hypothetical protein